MRQPSEDDNEWYLIFGEAKYDHWIFKVIDKRMGHVYAVKDLNNWQWLVIQPRVNMTEAKILLKSEFPSIRYIADYNDNIVKVNARPKPEVRGFLNWFTCVEQVKALIGIKDPLALTPKQLYSNLIGGKYG
jgi:hypothetical protein